MMQQAALIATCLCSFAVLLQQAQGRRPEHVTAKIESHLENRLKPCFYYGRNCPPGLGNYESMEHDLPIMQAGLIASGIPMPSRCNCDHSSERCVRQCYYSVTKAMVMKSAVPEEEDDGEGEGEDENEDTRR